MKKFKLYITALLAAGVVSSCLVDDADPSTYAGDTPYIVGFDSASATNSYFADEGPVTKSYPVNLIGSASGYTSSNDIVINYSIDPASTAVEGQEYDFTDTSGTMTIPANSDYALFDLIVNTGGFDPVAPTTLIINLSTSTNNTIVSTQFSSLTVKFVGCLSTVDTYSYDVDIEYTDVAGAVSYYSNNGESFTATGVPNNFVTDTTGHWGPGALAPGDDGFYFEDICGDIFIKEQALGGYWGNTVQGYLGDANPAGSVDSVTGDIHVEYNVCFGGDCRKYKVDYTRL
jgi:hypothetical protein